MAKSDVDVHLQRVGIMVSDIKRFASTGTKGTDDFRADLAGLLIIAITSSYESCVKDVMVRYSSSKHADFSQFVQNNFERISGRISIDDLHRYTKLFGKEIDDSFKSHLKKRKKSVDSLSGISIESCYKQIFSWRNDFVHAGKRSTTIEESMKFHRFAKMIIYCFDAAFS